LTLGHIFAKPKDPVKTNQKTHAVYSIPCGDCEKEYLGQSKRQFGTRLKGFIPYFQLVRAVCMARNAVECVTVRWRNVVIQ
jgi:uncharacterized protein (DUF427 family)